jgi:hypothetical protein
MNVRSTPAVFPPSVSPLHALLASERDPHLRQRELVRASIMSCPGKTSPTHHRYSRAA